MLDLRIGLLLGLRQIQRANIWTTLLITSVILFTFINLVAISGILNGIIEGALKSVRVEALGDVIITPLEGENRVLETEKLLRELKTFNEIDAYSARYEGLATIEANYKERRDLSVDRDIIAANITGIDPDNEDATTGLSTLVGEGSYFDADDQGYILIGKYYIDRYAEKFGDVFDSLKNVHPGDTVRVTVGTQSEEFIVKGIVDSKIDLVSLNIYIPEREFRRLYDRADHNANQINIRLKPDYSEEDMRTALTTAGFTEYAKVKPFAEAVPKFITDVTKTFNMLGILIGAIGIVVASITVFIIIFINALSRRRQIGILKAIGITERAIEYAYITQAAFYATVGSALGLLIVFLMLVPYFEQNPIDFPFSDGTLAATAMGTTLRCLALFLITLIAGFLPAWLIVRQNTLNAILGRK